MWNIGDTYAPSTCGPSQVPMKPSTPRNTSTLAKVQPAEKGRAGIVHSISMIEVRSRPLRYRREPESCSPMRLAQLAGLVTRLTVSKEHHDTASRSTRERRMALEEPLPGLE